MRCFYVRGRGNQSDAGYGLCPQTPASFAMHHGEEVILGDSVQYKRWEMEMPTFSRSLEQSLHRALALANERHHEYATLEHLLLALIEDQDAAAVMRACNVDLDKLRRSLVAYLESELDNLVTDGAEDSKPTAGFQRVIQRAVIQLQSFRREWVPGANVLVAIFAERESHAAYFLQEQDMTRYDAVNYISHGIAKRPGMS